MQIIEVSVIDMQIVSPKLIDKELVLNLENALSSFRNIRSQSNFQKDLMNGFYSLADAFYRVIDARRQAIDDAITVEEYDKLNKIPNYKITIDLDWGFEKLLRNVSAEIADFADFAKQATPQE